MRLPTAYYSGYCTNISPFISTLPKIFSQITIALFCLVLPASANTITINSSASSGSGWTYSSGVITASANVTINATAVRDYLVTGNLEIQAGTDIIIDASINPALGAGITHTLTLKASRDIIVQATRNISPTSGLLNIIVWSDADGNNAGMIYCKGTSVLNTKGGHLWLGGGNGNTTWNGLTVGNGFAASGTVIGANELISGSSTFSNGISLYNCSLLSEGGNISVSGRSANGTTTYGNMGIFMGFNALISSDAGNINVQAQTTGAASPTGTGWLYGLLIYTNDNTATSNGTAGIVSTSGAITVQCNGQTNYSGNHSAGFCLFTTAVTGTAKIQSSTGSISVTGENGNATNPSYGGVYMTGAGNEWVVSRSGNITVTGTSAGTPPGIRMDASTRLGYDGTNSYTGNIKIISNLLTLAATAYLQSSGNLEIEPYTASRPINLAGTGDLSLSASYFTTNFVNGFNSIRIGNSSQSGNITLGAVTLNDHLILQTTGSVTQTGAISGAAQQLSLEGTGGAHTLTNAGNNIQQLAANTGAIHFVNSTALTLNQILSTSTIHIRTLAGNLTIGQNISTTNTSNTAIQLLADANRTAGDATGGNIMVSGTPVITTGTGGRGMFYSGSVANSTGLLSLVGGIANARDNVDATTVTFTPALSSGIFALYRDNSSALPVSLVNFRLHCNTESVVLQWGTVTENMNRGFTIERSADQVNWKAIGFVTGAGASSLQQHYSFTDPKPLTTPLAYYRLRQQDYDGSTTLSQVLAARCGNSNSQVLSNIRFYPNPTPGKLVVTGLTETGTYAVFGQKGEKLQAGNISGNQAEIALDTLTPGVYYIQLKAGNEERTIRVVKR